MQLGDIYIHRQNGAIIQINSYASHMGHLAENSIIVFCQIEQYGEESGSCPSFNGYGTEEEIESEYELLVSREKLKDYSSWNEILALCELYRNERN